MDSIKLTASNGRIFTNGEAYGTTVYLGANDAPENWHEITIEEYEEKMKEESGVEQ